MTKLGWRKLNICPKVTKMGSIIGHRIDYNGVGALRGQLAHTQQKFTQVIPPGDEAIYFEQQTTQKNMFRWNF